MEMIQFVPIETLIPNTIDETAYTANNMNKEGSQHFVKCSLIQVIMMKSKVWICVNRHSDSNEIRESDPQNEHPDELRISTFR
jgi:hypothetical protein